MISKKGLRFNCAESTLLRINDRAPLPGLDPAVMRIISGFGGGVAGWGSACGAVSGAVTALGLLYGTEGNEAPDEFQERRARLRELAQGFLASFERKFGSVNCMDLLGVDRRTEEGRRRYDELKKQGAFHCDEYVEWASEKIIGTLDET